MKAAPKISNFNKRPKDSRPSAHARGYGSNWRKIRQNHLAREPLCVECKKNNIDELASVVDHIIPHKGNVTLFNDPKNLQSLCKRHHDQKTAREDGGFGN